MITLFIDTSSSDVSIAIINDNQVITSITKEIPNKHSVYTVKFIDDCIKESKLSLNNIDKIMVVTGPGSFTGVRIGVTIAKTIAYLLKKDIIQVSSLKMLSLSTSHNYCLSLINANHDNYYIALYDKNNNEIIKEKYNNKEKVLAIINKYNPTIVSDNNIRINNYNINKTKLDFLNIVKHYKNELPINCHLIVPNYLKLPQALEKNND